MRKIITLATVLVLICFLLSSQLAAFAATPKVKLGNELLLTKYQHLLKDKRVGLVTNHTGVNSQGKSTVEVLAADPSVRLVALYGPEHGIDGKAKAGEYVASYTHPVLKIPVYSLYGATRMPTKEMLDNVDVLVFDMQDIGSRTYTYISTLNYCMVAAQKFQKRVIVLDRPNPVGGQIVDGPVLEEPYKSFVGIDILPMAHGMTVGEIAKYFNRNIGADLEVVPMEGYVRTMVFQDTGLPWVPTSPNIPDLESAFGYMATGIGEGTGIYQADKFKWIGGKGINAEKYAALLNKAGLPGVTFIPETKGEAGGVRLKITDYHTFNPAKTGIYTLAYAYSLTKFTVPKSGKSIVMFDKVMGTNKIGQYLEQGLTPQQIEAKYAAALNSFKEDRKKHLIYGQKKHIDVLVSGTPVVFDTAPYLDKNNRLMVPLRAIVEALGANVAYDAQTKKINISKSGNTVIFTINQTTAIVNGQTKTMDTSAVIKNSRTMIPLRYVSEYLGANVNWDQANQTVHIH